MGQPGQPLAPSPIPTQWGYGIAETPDGVPFVYIQVAHAAGALVAFVSADEADQIASQIAQVATQARAKSTGLLLPPGVGRLISPNGAPLSSTPPPQAPPPHDEEAPDSP